MSVFPIVVRIQTHADELTVNLAFGNKITWL